MGNLETCHEHVNVILDKFAYQEVLSAMADKLGDAESPGGAFRQTSPEMLRAAQNIKKLLTASIYPNSNLQVILF